MTDAMFSIPIQTIHDMYCISYKSICGIHHNLHIDSLQAYTMSYLSITGLILGLHPANERCRYKVTASLIGGAQT